MSSALLLFVLFFLRWWQLCSICCDLHTWAVGFGPAAETHWWECQRIDYCANQCPLRSRIGIGVSWQLAPSQLSTGRCGSPLLPAAPGGLGHWLFDGMQRLLAHECTSEVDEYAPLVLPAPYRGGHGSNQHPTRVLNDWYQDGWLLVPPLLTPCTTTYLFVADGRGAVYIGRLLLNALVRSRTVSRIYAPCNDDYVYDDDDPMMRWCFMMFCFSTGKAAG
jgi:hypothetical protein